MTDDLTLDADAVIWSAPEPERAGKPLLVLLHGYGSDERDLFGLAPYLPEGFVVASVRAPLSPPFPTPGWSWYPIEGLESRDPAAVTEYNVRFTSVVPVPNDGIGAELVFSGRVKSVDEESKSVTIAISATTGGKKIFGRAVATAKLA